MGATIKNTCVFQCLFRTGENKQVKIHCKLVFLFIYMPCNSQKVLKWLFPRKPLALAGLGNKDQNLNLVTPKHDSVIKGPSNLSAPFIPPLFLVLFVTSTFQSSTTGLGQSKNSQPKFRWPWQGTSGPFLATWLGPSRSAISLGNHCTKKACTRW